MAESIVADNLGKRAMVIDDDERVARLASRWLSDAGCTVANASSFEEGLTAIRGACPDILIADVRLGDFNGIHLAIVAREQRKDVRVVLISGWDDPVLRGEAEACGASYLCKPLSRTDLLKELGMEPAHRSAEPSSSDRESHKKARAAGAHSEPAGARRRHVSTGVR